MAFRCRTNLSLANLTMLGMIHPCGKEVAAMRRQRNMQRSKLGGEPPDVASVPVRPHDWPNARPAGCCGVDAAAVERIGAAAAANLRRCERMREAALAKAFRGELV